MITYRGLPAPLICDYLSREESRNLYAEGTEFHIVIRETRFQVSGFRFQVSGFRFQVSG
jgi:hypothetical protein